MKPLLLIVFFFTTVFSVAASENYRITLLRATPGGLAEMIKQVRSYKTMKKGNLSIMRHSQGDHWDLMLLEPTGPNPTSMMDFGKIADFQHSFLAKSEINWDKIKPMSEASDLFHIEMFSASHGKSAELLKQRRMENTYLLATQRRPNVIFETTFGSDVDSFTIGYYTDMVQFATMPELPAEVFSKAAIDAGFESRDTIGLYLRELIVSHNDTLATRVD